MLHLFVVSGGIALAVGQMFECHDQLHSTTPRCRESFSEDVSLDLRNSVALCLHGSPSRINEDAVESISNHVLGNLHAGVDTFVAPGAIGKSVRDIMRKTLSEVIKPASIIIDGCEDLAVDNLVAALGLESNGRQPWTVRDPSLKSEHDPDRGWGRDLGCVPHSIGCVNTMYFEAFSWKRCEHLIREAETRRGAEYEWVILSRNDLKWEFPHPPLELLDNAHIWAMHTTNWEVPENHLEFNRLFLPTIASLWSSVACPTREYHGSLKEIGCVATSQAWNGETDASWSVSYGPYMSCGVGAGAIGPEEALHAHLRVHGESVPLGLGILAPLAYGTRRHGWSTQEGWWSSTSLDDRLVLDDNTYIEDIIYHTYDAVLIHDGILSRNLHLRVVTFARDSVQPIQRTWRVQRSESLVPIIQEGDPHFSGVVYCAKHHAAPFTRPNNPPLFIFACVEAGRLVPPTSESCGAVRQVSFYTSLAYGRSSFGIECISGVDEEKIAVSFLGTELRSGYAVLLRLGQKSILDFVNVRVEY